MFLTIENDDLISQSMISAGDLNDDLHINIIDVLMAPLNSLDLTLGYTLGSVTRGIVCGLVTFAGIIIFVPLQIYSWFALLYFTLIIPMVLKLNDVWTCKYNFIVTPALRP